MGRLGARGMGAGVAVGLLLVAAVGCGTPQPSVSPASPSVVASPTLIPPAVVVPSTAVAASPTPAPPPTAVAEEPKVDCGKDASTWTETDAHGSPVPIVITLTCENAVAAAKQHVGPDPAVVSIEFGYGWWCPPGFFCVMSPPNAGHVIFHTRGRRPDIVVSVKADAAGRVTAFDQRPLPSPAG
jgi:hypothetical protein